MDTTETTHTILSYCTGMRGLERGIERTGIRMRVAAFLEIEAFICANLVSAMEKGFLDSAPIWTNIKTFDPEPFRGKVDGFIGGYPCQPFSLAGKLKGEDDPRHLWPFIAKHIRAIRPVWCFFENVGNHLKLGYETVRGELQEMGYHVEEGIYAASEVGAPHRRERLFILAILDNSNYGSVIDSSNKNASDGCRKRLQQWHINKKSECSSELDNSTCVGHVQSGNEISARRHTIEFASEEELGDPANIRLSGFGANAGTSGKDTQGEECRLCESARASSLSGYDPSAITMADTDESGSQIGTFEKRQPGNLWNERIDTSQDNSRHEQLWPARPGESQQAWESPRVLSREAESALGIATHGYNFREDLLRMAGNGVVSQQAEYAFRDLIRKHGEAMKQKEVKT